MRTKFYAHSMEAGTCASSSDECSPALRRAMGSNEPDQIREMLVTEMDRNTKILAKRTRLVQMS